MTRRNPKIALLLSILDEAYEKKAWHGIAAHDLYHTGQIQLLKRLYGKRNKL